MLKLNQEFIGSLGDFYIDYYKDQGVVVPDNLVRRQLQTEVAAVERQRDKEIEALSNDPIGTGLINGYIGKMAEHCKHSTNKSGYDFNRPEVHYLTLKVLLDSCYGDSTEVKTASVKIADAILMQRSFTRLTEIWHKDFAKQDLTFVNTRERIKYYQLQLRRHNIHDSLSNPEKIALGRTLIEAAVDGTGLFTLVTQWKHGKKAVHVTLNDKVSDFIYRRKELRAIMEPIIPPMITPPIDWAVHLDADGFVQWQGGLLLNPWVLRMAFMRTSFLNLNIMYTHGGYERTVKIVNQLQRVPYRINQDIFSVLQHEYVKPDPEKPARAWSSDEEYQRLRKSGSEVVREWRSAMSDYYHEMAQIRGHNIRLINQIEFAKKCLNEPRIYFAWNQDFRGRIYPVQNWVTPQSDDLGKALLLFAETKELGPDGLRWLYIHASNSWGFDKAPLSDRQQWTHDHLHEIMDCAMDPRGVQWWREADDPWQFLAACFEIRKAHLYPGGIEKFPSSLPVFIDGSCNGLQHYSAMLRDPLGAASVNLIDGEKPADVYADVARETERLIQKDIEAIDTDEFYREAALKWRGKVTRKVTKRNVMTTPYGVTKIGMKDQLDAELSSLGKPVIDVDTLGQQRRYTLYLSKKIYDALGVVLSKARDAMDYLKVIAHECLKHDAPLIWTTPMGQKIIQNYPKYDMVRLCLFLGERRVRVRAHYRKPMGMLDKGKNTTGFPPNFVHSLDASHLLMTAETCFNSKLLDVSFVHDSYGTHAANVPLLGKLIREQFVKMYQPNILQKLKEETEARLGITLPDPPKTGTFDLDGVLSSTYFFN